VVELYGDTYFNKGEYADYLGEKIALQRSFRWKIQRMRSVSPGIQRVCEIGSAYGFFLELAQREWEVMGVEIAPEPSAYARENFGVNVHTGDLLQAPIPAAYYDTFCMWDTIEHLRDPSSYVERIAALIRPGGFLFLTTGDAGSFLARLRGSRWRLIHPPTHLFYFTRATIAKLLESHGFQVREVRSIGVHRSVQQTVGSVVAGPSLVKARNWIEDSRLGSFVYSLNLGDIMMVAAQIVTGR
jgi:SAM-dependent methyltransferase